MGSFGINGGYNPDQKVGMYTRGELDQLKQYSLQLIRQKAQESLYAARLQQIQKQQGTQNSGNTAENIVKNAVNTGTDIYKTIQDIKSKKTSSDTQTQQTGNTPKSTSTDGTSQTTGSGNTPSGIATGVDTSDSIYDTTSLDNISTKLANPDISAEDLTAMKAEIGTSKADVTAKLSAAQADLSNIQSQQQTAESNVTRLEGEVNTAETTKNDAKKNFR